MSGFNKLNMNFELILKDAGIPHRAIEAGKLQITFEQFKDLANAMSKYMDQEHILQISTVDTVASFVPEFFAGLCASNGRECIERVSKYKKIIAPIKILVSEEDNEVSLSYEYFDGTPVHGMMLIHSQLSILSLIRKGTGNESIKPLSVSSSGGYPENAKAYFGVTPIKVKEGNKLIFSKLDLQRHFITENNRMWDYMESELNQRLREIEVDESFSAKVRRVLYDLLPSGVSEADAIAKELGISKRTLQRKLKDDKTSFNEQLNHTRELMVRNYLQMEICLDEIAFLVNYSDAKSLSRAFKTWTGMNISEYKKKHAIV